MSKFHIQFLGVNVHNCSPNLSNDTMKRFIYEHVRHQLNDLLVNIDIFGVDHSVKYIDHVEEIQYRSYEKILVDDKFHNKLLLLHNDYYTNNEKTSSMRRWRMTRPKNNMNFCLIVDEMVDGSC